MKLEEGISVYVQQKQAMGMSFAKGYTTYRAFLRTVGKLAIGQITVHHVSEFLDRPQTSAAALSRRHSLLRRFLEYWAAHCAIAELPMPANRPAQRSNFGSGAKMCDRQEGCVNWGRDYASITAPQISGEALSLRRKRPRENCFL
jgi:hypothetical protein